MRALAGPALLLVLIGGYGLNRALTAPEGPSRDFLDLELAGADEDETGACYSLSTVIIANTAFSSAMLTWKPAGENAWTLSLEEVVDGHGGPTHEFQRFTFKQYDDLVYLEWVEASKGRNTEIDANIDQLLRAPNGRRSTPVDRCREPGATGYLFRRK